VYVIDQCSIIAGHQITVHHTDANRQIENMTQLTYSNYQNTHHWAQ